MALRELRHFPTDSGRPTDREWEGKGKEEEESYFSMSYSCSFALLLSPRVFFFEKSSAFPLLSPSPPLLTILSAVNWGWEEEEKASMEREAPFPQVMMGALTQQAQLPPLPLLFTLSPLGNTEAREFIPDLATKSPPSPPSPPGSTLLIV